MMSRWVLGWLLLASGVVLGAEREAKPRRYRGPIQDAIDSGAAANYNKDDCIWRQDKDSCPDPLVRLYLHTPGDKPRRELLPDRQSDLLRYDYDHTKDNVLLVHGYAGGDESLPMMVLRDAYLRNGSYNVFVVDWGELCAPPCYPAAVKNLKPVGRCLAGSLTALRDLGLPISRTSCVGHSLGAHLCGIIANHLLFRMHRIVGLDPARPLVPLRLVNRLDSGDADFVEVIHTNAGYYGELGRMGHVDFCVNGGKMQPFCADRAEEQLCSHVWAVCFMAQSIDRGGRETMAEPCSRRCPSGPRIGQRPGEYVSMGQHTPAETRGSFCFSAHQPPYCPRFKGDRGDERCCTTRNNLDHSLDMDQSHAVGEAMPDDNQEDEPEEVNETAETRAARFSVLPLLFPRGI